MLVRFVKEVQTRFALVDVTRATVPRYGLWCERNDCVRVDDRHSSAATVYALSCWQSDVPRVRRFRAADVEHALR